jgi:hypothetical protein
VRADFDHHARLSTSFPGYVYREEQVRLAEAIAADMQAGHVLLAEAETGIGKTLAYLVPALRAEGRTLISTHTRALQDQLVHRDIPAVMRALDVRRQVALLKGRANYLCPFRLKRHMALPRLDPGQRRWLGQVMDWSHKTRDGDLAGLAADEGQGPCPGGGDRGQQPQPAAGGRGPEGGGVRRGAAGLRCLRDRRGAQPARARLPAFRGAGVAPAPDPVA